MRMHAAAAALLLSVALPVVGSAPAHAADGVCADATGTTVVVDFTDLGGDVEVGCAEDSDGMTGLQALEAAGFDTATVASSDVPAVCRIDDEPSASEAIDVGGRDYTERCQEFPPAGAYWSYYVAPAGGAWAYATTGADTNKAVPGGFEGWRFQLDQPADAAPTPAFDPANPPTATADDSVDKADTAADSSDEADENDGTSIVWIGIAVAVLLAVAIAVTLVRRRSSEDV